MVCFLGTGITERNKKRTVAQVSRLRLPLRFSLIVPIKSFSRKVVQKFWGEVSVLSLPLNVIIHADNWKIKQGCSWSQFVMSIKDSAISFRSYGSGFRRTCFTRWRNRRWWVRLINQRRFIQGDYYNLYQQLQLDDTMPHRYIRLDLRTLHQFLGMVYPHLVKKCPRAPLSPEHRLLIALRYVV